MTLNKKSGAVMVLTLWLIIVLMVMAYSLAYEMRLGLKSASFAQRRLKAEALAREGVARAVIDLRNDGLLAFSNPNNYVDTLDDIWAREDDDHIDVKGGDGNGHFSVIVRDENRKIDVNQITQQNMNVLVYLLKSLYKIKEDDGKMMAQALIDYRDQDLKPISGQGASEVEAYTDWGIKAFGRDLPQDWVFRPKNDDLQNLDELLMIPGFTQEMLYGDPAEAGRDPFEREHRKSRERHSDMLSDYVTVNSLGGINLNTASEDVLTALFAGMNIPDSSAPGFAKKVLELRQSRKHVKQDGVKGITNPTQLREAGIPDPLVTQLNSLIPLAVRSPVYMITARGEYQGVRQTVQARVSESIESYQSDPKDRRRRQPKRDERGIGLIKNKPDLRVDPAVRVVWMKTPTE